jgi:hypothetical protein
MNTCGYNPYVTSSLTRGWVCSLHSLLVLVSAAILKSESRRAHDHILLSQIRDSPNLEGQVPVFISPRNRLAQLYPRRWVPFSSPPTTRRATVEVFDPTNFKKYKYGRSVIVCHIWSSGIHGEINFNILSKWKKKREWKNNPVYYLEVRDEYV